MTTLKEINGQFVPIPENEQQTVGPSVIINCTNSSIKIRTVETESNGYEMNYFEEGIHTRRQTKTTEIWIPMCNFSDYNYKMYPDLVKREFKGEKEEYQGIPVEVISKPVGRSHMSFGPITDTHPIFTSLSENPIIVTERTLELIVEKKIKRKGIIFYIPEWFTLNINDSCLVIDKLYRLDDSCNKS